MVDDRLRAQLRRLGLRRGTRHLSSPPSEAGTDQQDPKESAFSAAPTLSTVASARRRGKRPIEDLLPGQVVETGLGSFFLYRESYKRRYRHGHHFLDDLFAYPTQVAGLLARDERLAGVDLRRLAFVDTETTGLAGGTGTYAFLVGVGLFEADHFTIHQFFMRDFHEEPALLDSLGQLLDGVDGVVSFNGKSFDLPLLETRFIMGRQPRPLTQVPHLDLLPPARRLWKYRLTSCALSSLETGVLGIQRNQADVPGWAIPGLYVDYARTGDARQMPRIFYHNAQDILSLVTLMTRQCSLVSTPLSPDLQVPSEDLYGLARLLQDVGDLDRAEAALTQAAMRLSSQRPEETRRSPQPCLPEMAMRDLATLLKKQGRRHEALPWWQRLVETAAAVDACEELAKYYEWHDLDLQQAIAWTSRGKALAEEWPPSPKKRTTLAGFSHRLDRLQRKLDAF